MRIYTPVDLLDTAYIYQPQSVYHIPIGLEYIK